jgi:hypothetical protein
VGGGTTGWTCRQTGGIGETANVWPCKAGLASRATDCARLMKTYSCCAEFESEPLFRAYSHASHASATAKPPVAKAAPLSCQGTQAGARRRIVTVPVPIANRSPVRTEDRTSPSLADTMRLTRTGYRVPVGRGRHHFFEAISFNTALSSIASANSRFRRISGTARRGTPPKARNIRTWAPIQSGSAWLQLASA